MAELRWGNDAGPEQIVRTLAEQKMYDLKCNQCRFCGGNISDTMTDEDDDWWAYHEPGCIWNEAKNWVRAHPIKEKVNAL